MLPGEERLELCRLAAEGHPGIEVSDIEIRRGGVSYTYQTLEAIAEPNKELYLIVGGDMFLSIGSWKNAIWISQTTTVCAAPRTADQLPILQKHAEALEGWGFRVIVLDIPVLDISSTELRKLIREGEDTSRWLDDQVAKRIREKRFYQ